MIVGCLVIEMEKEFLPMFCLVLRFALHGYDVYLYRYQNTSSSQPSQCFDINEKEVYSRDPNSHCYHSSILYLQVCSTSLAAQFVKLQSTNIASLYQNDEQYCHLNLTHQNGWISLLSINIILITDPRLKFRLIPLPSCSPFASNSQI